MYVLETVRGAVRRLYKSGIAASSVIIVSVIVILTIDAKLKIDIYFQTKKNF